MGTTHYFSDGTMKVNKINPLPPTAELIVYPWRKNNRHPQWRVPPFKVTEKDEVGELISLDKEKSSQMKQCLWLRERVDEYFSFPCGPTGTKSGPA